MTAPMDSSFSLEPRLTEVGICALGNNNAHGVKHDWKEYVRSLTYDFRFCLRYWGRHNWKRHPKRLERKLEKIDFAQDLAVHVAITSVSEVTEAAAHSFAECRCRRAHSHHCSPHHRVESGRCPLVRRLPSGAQKREPFAGCQDVPSGCRGGAFEVSSQASSSDVEEVTRSSADAGAENG